MSFIANLSRPTGFRQTLASALLLAGTTITVGSALLFQYVGGFIPCALCLQQRIPYYVAIPITLVAFVAAAGRAPALVTRLLILAIGVIMLVSLYLGIFHAGVEWHFWQGPADCAQVAGGDLAGGDLLSTIDSIRPPSCSEAAARFLGLSFAGWNAIASALFAAIGLRSAFAKADRMV